MMKLLTGPLRILIRAGAAAILLGPLGHHALAQGLSLATIRDPATMTTTVLVQGAIGERGSVLVSENLSQWTDLGSFTLAGAPFQLVDAQSQQRPLRFYRVTTTANPLPDLSSLANSVFMPGEGFDTLQYAPNGSLGFIVWRNRDLVFRERTSSANWTETAVSSDGATYNSVAERQFSNFQPAAVLVYDSQSIPHVFVAAGGNRISHRSRNGGNWSEIETLTAPGSVNRLVGTLGTQNSFHLGVLTSGSLVHGLGRGGSWTWSTVDTVGGDGYWMPGSYSRRWLSVAVDSQNAAHFVYRPSFDFTTHPEGYMRAYTKLKYASNRGGSWQGHFVREPDDISGEVGSGQSIAIGPNDKPAIASWYNERGDGGSASWSRLQFYELADSGAWTRSEVISRPAGYIAGDGEKGTGAYPYVRFDRSGRPHIIFTDHAAQHFPYQNEYAGNLRHAVRENGTWRIDTVFSHNRPLDQQILFPAFAIGASEIAFIASERLTTWNTSVNPQVATSTYKFRFLTRAL
ncbi:MAG: hypothetical protein ACXW32_00190 [Limisphaerales bacterium]